MILVCQSVEYLVRCYVENYILFEEYWLSFKHGQNMECNMDIVFTSTESESIVVFPVYQKEYVFLHVALQSVYLWDMYMFVYCYINEAFVNWWNWVCIKFVLRPPDPLGTGSESDDGRTKSDYSYKKWYSKYLYKNFNRINKTYVLKAILEELTFLTR